MAIDRRAFLSTLCAAITGTLGIKRLGAAVVPHQVPADPTAGGFLVPPEFVGEIHRYSADPASIMELLVTRDGHEVDRVSFGAARDFCNQVLDADTLGLDLQPQDMLSVSVRAMREPSRSITVGLYESAS